MLELPHVIVGATIATKISNPLISLPLAFLSNFILDILPHWNPHLYAELNNKKQISKTSLIIVLVDASLALAGGLFLAFRFFPDINKVIIILLGSFIASVADLVEAPYFFLNSRNKYILKLISFQRSIQFNAPVIPGLISQGLLLGICFWLSLS